MSLLTLSRTALEQTASHVTQERLLSWIRNGVVVLSAATAVLTVAVTTVMLGMG
jgi:hypothetical protein